MCSLLARFWNSELNDDEGSAAEAAKAIAVGDARAADRGRPEEPRHAQMFESHNGGTALIVVRGSPNDKRRRALNVRSS